MRVCVCVSGRLSLSLSTAWISCGAKLHLTLSFSLSLTSEHHMTPRNIPSFAGAEFQHPTLSDKCAQAYTRREKVAHTHPTRTHLRRNARRSVVVTVAQLLCDSHYSHVDLY